MTNATRRDTPDDDFPPVIAMCQCCHQGYISHLFQRPCHRCGAKVIAIGPIPNRWPFVDGPYVRMNKDGSLPRET